MFKKMSAKGGSAFGGKNKKFLLLLPILLLSASCTLFSKKITAGTIKSVNGGSDWQFSNTIKDSKSTLSALNVSRMAFDPGNREVVYASGYNSGLFKSEDSAGTWRKILDNILVYDFVISPLDGKTMYAAGVFADHGRLLLTRDGGASWQQIFNEGSTANPVRTVALNPNNLNQVIIGTNSGNVIRSDDGGLNWRLMKDFGDRVQRILWQGDKVYVLLRNNGLFVSSNAGQDFADLGIVPGSSSIFSQLGNASSQPRTFNQFFVDSVAPSLLYVSTNNGLVKSTDGGKTWTFLALPIKQEDVVVRAVAVAKNSSNLVFASVGSTIYKSTDGGSTWQTQAIATDGFINYILIDPQLPQIVYGGIYGEAN